MKKINSIIIALLLVFAASFCLACEPKEPLVIKESDTYIVITVSNEQMELTSTTTLLDYMNSLKEDGELEFGITDGMITSVNEIANEADYSSCWMLYTDDTDNANDAWGSVEYKDKVYGSAIVGAEMLKVKDGCVYIWIYQEF